jgi:arsenate reductase
MAKVKVYYNPRCVTCRRAIDKLEENKVEYELRDFFKNKLGKDELRTLLKMAGLTPRDVLRKKDKMYKELKIGEKEYSDEQLLAFMEKYHGLILRPILVRNKSVVIANRPEIAEAFCKRGIR